MTEPQNFSWADYTVFGIILSISASIGVYHALRGGGQKTTQEFLLANRSMSAVPVALSVLASFFSASTLLGTPAEIYMQGAMYWLSVIGACMAPLVGAYLFGPLFFRLKMVSVNEYLERRFESKSVRVLGALLFLIRATLGMGIVMFGPATALEAVTGFPTWAGIVTVGGVCCIYTALGGIKAVIWTDVFQTCIMLAGMLAVLIQGAIETGGIMKAWEICDKYGRVNFWDADVSPTRRHTVWTLLVGNFFAWLVPYSVDQQMVQRFSSVTDLRQARLFNPDPTIRHTFWTLTVGNFFVWLPPYSVDQQMIQRFSSTKSLYSAKLSLLLNIPGMFIIISLCVLAGIFMFAYYAMLGCDPLSAGIVDEPNQLLPRFVMDILGKYPGIPGLFMSALFSGALSSVSSMLNSLAAVTWEDFCKLSSCARAVSDERATIINKLFSVMYAIIGICMAFVFSNIGGTVLQMSIAFNGSAGAPMVGLFLLGAFFPFVNWIGALAGGIVGFIFPMWISIGAYATKPDVMLHMEFPTENCPSPNFTNLLPMTSYMTSEIISTTTSSPEGIVKLYTLSYLYYSVVGMLVTVFVAVVVSLFTGCSRGLDVDSRLLISYADTFWPCCPEACRRGCRCGIDYDKVVEDDADEISEKDAGPVSVIFNRQVSEKDRESMYGTMGRYKARHDPTIYGTDFTNG